MNVRDRLGKIEEALRAQAPQRDYSGWTREQMIQEILARLEARPELSVIVAEHLPEGQAILFGEMETD
jgi:hypothetical protein